jgi:integrase
MKLRDLLDKKDSPTSIPDETLGRFLASYIQSQTDAPPWTLRKLSNVRKKLVQFFGDDKPLADLVPDDAQAFFRWLQAPKPDGLGLAAETVRKQTEIARRIFKVIPESPLAKPGMWTGSHRAETLKRFAECLGREPLVTDLTSDKITHFLDWRVARCGVLPTNANKEAGALVALAKLAVRRGLLADAPDPARFPDKSPAPIPTPKPVSESPPDSLWQLLEQFWSRKGTGAPETKKKYTITLRHFQKHLGRAPLMVDLNDVSIADFLRARKDQTYCLQPISPATLKKDRENLMTLTRWAHAKGMIRELPDVPRIQVPERIPIAWSREELANLWDALMRQTGEIGGVPSNLWWIALHAVIWDTGERIGATIKLEWRDVDLDGKWLVMRGENRKMKTRDRGHRLHPDTVNVLRSIQQPERALIFPWHLNPAYLWRVYTEILRDAKLHCDRKHKFHCLRKSVASYFEAAGGNAQVLMDHSERSVTRHYLDPRVVPEQNATDLLFRPDDPDDPDDKPDVVKFERRGTATDSDANAPSCSPRPAGAANTAAAR